MAPVSERLDAFELLSFLYSTFLRFLPDYCVFPVELLFKDRVLGLDMAMSWIWLLKDTSLLLVAMTVRENFMFSFLLRFISLLSSNS